MRSVKLFLVFLGLLGALQVFAQTYLAKSTDSCYMIANLLPKSEHQAPGIVFKATALNNHRLDVHCEDFVIKLQSNMKVFIANLTTDDLQQCYFHDHHEKAGLDGENHKVGAKKFTLVAEE